ncbi:MAG: SDR family oxidoreductase [Syntrophales bacterium]|jgi:NAD(P)-dependent dehydrogenase (short-subunit alcohol dehydrogenase family)|nr:SDR family oxidoreductase [Syntrophales bacterium]MDY0045020.1 SDR family NAD(P)-dependent oxidoreductase [Syntrophales bacterium]
MTYSGRLNGKVAIITGAASGIGKAAARLFAREGAKLVLADISVEALKEVAEEIKDQGGAAVLKKADVSKEDEVKELIDFSLSTYTEVHILCNNAGITGNFLYSNPEDQNSEDWFQVYAVNVMGAMYGIKHIAAHMKQRGSGAIVNTASVAGIRAGAGTNAYSASKAAVISLTQTGACDLGKFNVRVNAVCPGLTETGMSKPLFDYARETGKEGKLGNRCELRRYGKPEEIAAAILFLASDEASYITGQALPVDGGNTASLNLPGMKY